MLDKMINDIEKRFNQKSVNMIKSIFHLVILEVDNGNNLNLIHVFGLNQNELETEINLLISNDPISK